MQKLQNIIRNISFQLYTSIFLKCLLLALSVFFVVFTFSKSLIISVSSAVLSFILMAWQLKLISNQRPKAVSLIHQQLNDTEYSLNLLEKTSLNIAEQLQLERLFEKAQNLQTPTVFSKNLLYYLLVFVVSACLYFGLDKIHFDKKEDKSILNNQSQSTHNQQLTPKFISANLQIKPPAYTKLNWQNGSDLNATAIVGSELVWTLNFENSENLTVKLANTHGQELNFHKNGNAYHHSDKLLSSGFYAFKAYLKDSLIYQSDFYSLTTIADFAPKIEPTSKELYQFHLLKDPKTIQISAKISDDFLVNQAFIVATVARGSGENVKFREMKLPLSPTQFKQAVVSKTLDLKALNFAPGDELYYYWAAIDNKSPEPNFSKSDTYFIVYKDTAKVEETELATMAMNILPEYFRSQRQIIIDSEKLIKKRGKIASKDFNSISNELGFDQKALRLRYGQYLGEEFENSIGGGNPMPSEAEGDLLKGFVHAHDEGEHDHEDGEHAHNHAEENKNPNETKDPVAELLADYVHSHDDGEMNTFYEQSTRSLLKMALEQMWQSELHLRLYEPEKALPFENKALEYLKLAQQKARTYVKKTSFDPPPIKEKEKRMTGELTKFNKTFSKEKVYTQQQIEQLVAEVIGIIENKKSHQKLSGIEKQKVMILGNLASEKIMNSGIKNWSILSDLQALLNDKSLSENQEKDLKTKLLGLIQGFSDFDNKNQNRSYKTNSKLEKAFWRNIES